MSATSALAMRVLLTAVLLTWAVRPLPALQDSSQPAPQKPESSHPVFHSNVRRVILDVVVTDSNEKPVRGLSRKDFSIKEDGKLQQVLSFDAHEFDEIPNPLPKLPPLPSNTWVNVPAVPEKGPLYVILYDMVNMDPDDQATARKQLLKFISDKPDGARFAIYVLSDELRLVQGFTADQRKLFAAMDPASPVPHVPKVFIYGDNYGRGQVAPIVSVFTKIAHFLDGFAERKNVIWVTGSIPTTILPTENLNPNTEAVSYNDEIKEAINAMARSQIAVYPVDVRGVVVTQIQSRPKSGAGGASMGTTTDSTAVNASYSTETDIATATGGRAFYSTNDLSEALASATEAGANYYTLTYAPSNFNYDGLLRKIHVELSQRGYRLAYRRSYYAEDPNSVAVNVTTQSTDLAAQSVTVEPADSLTPHLRHGAPVAHQLFFGAHVHTAGVPAMATPEQMLTLEKQQSLSRPRGKSHRTKSSPPVLLQAYAIDYTVSAQQIKRASQTDVARPFLLELALAVFDDDGQMLISKVQRAREASPSSSSEAEEDSSSSFSEKPDKAVFYHFQQQIEAPLNAKSIRIAVREVFTDRVGAIEIALPLAPEPQTQATAPVQPRPTDADSTNPN
jgi:VWFA-related protein